MKSSEKFNNDDLKLIPCPNNPVMLKSGGSIMSQISFEGNKVLCEWEEDGKISRSLFNKKCLYKLEEFKDEHPDREAN